MARRKATTKQDPPEVYTEHPATVEEGLPWWQVYKPTAASLRQLTDLQVAMVDAYVRNPGGGYKGVAEALGTTVHRVKKHLAEPHVQEYKERRFTELRASAEVTKERVVFGLLTEAERDTASQSARVKAWELLGKEIGMFVERSERKSDVSASIKAEVQAQAGVQIYLPDNRRDPGITGEPVGGQADAGAGQGASDEAEGPN